MNRFLHRVLWTIASVLLAAPIIQACSWTYTIWGIRSKNADALFRFVRDGKVGYIDVRGRTVIKPTLPYEGNFFGEFHEGLLAVREEFGKPFQYLDRSGKEVFRIEAFLTFDFSEGLAPAAPSIPRGQYVHKWGFIDRTGRYTIAAQFFEVSTFSEGLARVAVEDQFNSTGYIDRNGTFIIEPKLTHGADFSEGLAAVIVDGPCRTTNGGSCSSLEFEPTSPGAGYDCRYAYIDRQGRPISTLRFDDATDFSEGRAAIRVGALWGYIDNSGRFSIPPRFEWAGPFSENFAAVRFNGKSGFVDYAGQFVIAPQYDYVGDFSHGRALVLVGSGVQKYRYIDKSGKPAFSGVFDDATPFRNGLAHVAVNQRSGRRLSWIDTSGKAVFSYDERR